MKVCVEQINFMNIEKSSRVRTPVGGQKGSDAATYFFAFSFFLLKRWELCDEDWHRNNFLYHRATTTC